MPKNDKPRLRIIGDVHGKLREYTTLAKQATYSLCVGDVGFDYRYITQNLHPKYHKCIGGNHDNYTTKQCCSYGCDKCEGRRYTFSVLSRNFLKDFGTWNVPGFGSLFYVRGAWSIDADYRLPGISWWPDEELNYQQMIKAIEEYKKVKPNFVVTHTVPQCIVPHFFKGSMFGSKIYTPRTEQGLENMYHVHQPDTWVFGHWHYDWEDEIEHAETGKKTRFICLSELKYKDFDKGAK